jgi:hypothetical protein
MKKSEDGDINNWTCLIISSLLFYNDCFTGLKSLASDERWLFVAPPESSPSVEIGLEARPSQGPHVFFVAHRVPSQHLFWGRLLYGRLSEDVRSPTGLSSFYQIAIWEGFFCYSSCQDTLKNGRITVQLCNIWGVEQTRTGGISLERWDKLHFIGIDGCVQCEAPKICLLVYKPQ